MVDQLTIPRKLHDLAHKHGVPMKRRTESFQDRNFDSLYQLISVLVRCLDDSTLSGNHLAGLHQLFNEIIQSNAFLKNHAEVKNIEPDSAYPYIPNVDTWSLADGMFIRLVNKYDHKNPSNNRAEIYVGTVSSKRS